jgi:hypothetical protein
MTVVYWLLGHYPLTFLDYFLILKKIKVGLWDLYAVCVSVNSLHWLSNAWTNLHETWYVYHGTWADLNGLLHESLPSVCVCICIPRNVARQRLSKHILAATDIYSNRRIVGRFCLCVCVSSLCRCYVATRWRHPHGKRRIVGGVVFYAVRVVSNESGRLVLPRTSCY